MGTSCAPLLAELVQHTNEADLLQGLLKNNDRNFNSSIRYIDDELSLNNSRFNDYLHLIYPNKVVVKNATYTQKSASYIDLYFESTMD